MLESKLWIDIGLEQYGFFGVPPWLSMGLAILFTMIFVVFPCAAFFYYLDRKLSADFQARVGPDQAGPRGLAQPVADLLKLIQKVSTLKWSWSENLWFAAHSMALYSTVAILPLGSLALLVDTEMSVFLPFWATLVLALGTMLLGLSQNSVPAWFGGIRVAAQTLAGAFPALIALLCVGVNAGSFKWSVLAGLQGFAPWSWTFVSNPFLALAFFVFLVSGLMLVASSPLDGGLSMSDIYGGVASHLDGKRLGFYRFGRFYAFFLWSEITVVLFLGGWALPLWADHLLKEYGMLLGLAFLELVWVTAKTLGLMFLVLWVARSSPRSRVDQMTDFSWKVLSPFGLVALVGCSIWAGWRSL